MVRRHPAALVRDGVVAVGAFALLLVVHRHVPPGGVRRLVDVAILVVLLRATWKVATWRAERFIVTDARILLVTGLLTRHVAMLPLRKVTDMSYRRSAWGRLFGYGEFVMESAGEARSLQRVRFLPDPDTLYLQLSELLFATGGALAIEEY